MRVGWARVECEPGYQLGNDENSWAFDGFNVRHNNILVITIATLPLKRIFLYDEKIM